MIAANQLQQPNFVKTNIFWSNRFYTSTNIHICTNAAYDIQQNAICVYIQDSNVPDCHQSILRQTSLEHLYLDALSASYYTYNTMIHTQWCQRLQYYVTFALWIKATLSVHVYRQLSCTDMPPDNSLQVAQLSLTCRPNACTNAFARGHRIVRMMYSQHLTPSMTGIPSSYQVQMCMKKLEWLGYNHVKVAWW